MTNRHDRQNRDTVKAFPVPSSNPTAALRDRLEREVKEARVGMMETRSGFWRGLLNENGIAHFHTIEIPYSEANEWLVVARSAARADAWIPDVCHRCRTIRTTPAMCATCMRGEP